VRATRSTWLNLQSVNEPPPRLEQATAAAELSPVVAQVLHNRGIDAEALPAFLSPHRALGHDPLGLLGMKEAVRRLINARKADELVAIYGDFDVDGITSVAVLMHACAIAGLRAIPYIPHRQDQGSGLNIAAIERLVAQGVGMIVTADCGINNGVESRALERLGIDLIITDHHAAPDVLPRAVAIVDPLQPGCAYPNKDLAGVGVAYKVARALLRAVGEPKNHGQALLDLVAVGTIADMVPLTGENRTLVWHGMRVLNNSPRPGLQAVISRCGLRTGTINSTDVGFRICPRLNAAGRLAQGSLGYELLMAGTFEEADAWAQKLEEKNAERQLLTERALTAIHEEIATHAAADDARLIMVCIESWASCVMGLLAGKLVEEFGKPVIVLCETGGEVRGSARGTRGFGVLEAFKANADLLDRFGGHEMAAGFTTRSNQIPKLAERLRTRAGARLGPDDVLPTLQIDAELGARELTWSLHQDLQLMEPFGVSNPLPVFLCRRMRILEYRRMGNNHLRMIVGKGDQRLPALVFRRGDLACHLRRNMEVDLVFSLEANDWNGCRTLQLRVRDLSFEPARGYDIDGARD
jgi:single-stranded-DNA-specific exonuclease